ncbi:hypothetical protein D1007_51819 [Hordeum vulgare]|nr:hypothetical protein D1007_51819 [Hordeum vulgare]
MRNSPPTFTETTEPLDAHEWICTIGDLLALVNYNEDREKVLYASHCLRGTTTTWRDGFKVMQGDRVITWADFKQGFCIYHIPSWIMDIKKGDFRVLKQGSGFVKEYVQKFNLLSRYAPEHVDIEAAKIELFMEGLQQAPQYQLVVCDCRTFFKMVNMALMLEDKRCAMEDTRKGSSSNQNPHPWHPAPAKPTYQPQQVRTPPPCPSY